MTEIICEICHVHPAERYYRNYVGPHAVCNNCFHDFVRTKKEIRIDCYKEEYVEDRVIDEIMGS